MSAFSRKIIKPFLAVSLGCLSLAANAAQPGYYLGGALGWGHVSNSGISKSDMSDLIESALGYPNFTFNSFDGDSSGSGFAWRVYGGYQFGYYWAGEMGWSIYPRLSVKATASGDDLITALPYGAGTEGTFKTGVFDAVVKGIYPLPCNFTIYGKLGLAFVTGWANESVTVTETNLSATAENNDTYTRLFPTAGVGVTYDFRPDMSLDLAYSRVQEVGESEQLGSLDMVSLGLVLHFG